MPDSLNGIKKAIEQQDSRQLVLSMFDKENGIPLLKKGFGYERSIWDFKENIPSARKSDTNSWSNIAADVLAFHNGNGGILIFGIRDRSFQFIGCNETIDTKMFNDKLRHFLGDRIYVYFSREFIQPDQRYLGIAIIPPRRSEYIRFRIDGFKTNGELYFSKGDIAIRENDETKIIRDNEAIKFLVDKGQSAAGSLFGVDEPQYRIIAPDYTKFINRTEYCEAILKALRSPRTFITALTGIGGVGKTALACWAVHEVYSNKDFSYICSVSAKDRELTTSGITAIKPMFTSYTQLLDQILITLGFSEVAPSDIAEREKFCQELMKNESILLFVDNLETVDDSRIIRFLEELPEGIKAIVTSRRLRVKVAAQPIEIGPFEENEALQFLESISFQKNRPFFNESMTNTERIKVVNSCDKIPIVIEWFVGRCRTAAEASDFADALAKNGFHSDELLEFCFRNVYAQMSTNMKTCLKAISIFSHPLPVEAIAAGTRLPIDKVIDSLEELRDYALIESRYDDTYRDDGYFLLPVTRAFVYREVKKQSGEEQSIRKNLSRWYDAEDVLNPAERELVREIRRGGNHPELTILELAKQKRYQGDHDTAERLFKMAIERNPKSWSALREYAEFCRHDRKSIGEALNLYAQAEPFIPKRGPDRALFYREWGILTRQEGQNDSQLKAIDRLNISLLENPNDRICRFALGQTYYRANQIQDAISVLEPIKDSSDSKTRQDTKAILVDCYCRLGNILKVAELRGQDA